ncbi:MAG: ubiquitin-like protein [Candidatus Hodarchaeota archaeon]
MRKKNRVLSIITLYVVFICIYLVFFLFHIDSVPLFLFLTISSVTVLSTSTIYTIIQSKGSYNERIREKKLIKKPKLIQRENIDIIEDYLDAMPSIEDYIESNESFEDNPVINKYIFSVFSPEELDEISFLGLSKTEKILFIREMLYFEPTERKILIDSMLNTRDKHDEEIIYQPPMNIIEMKDQIRVYIRSLVEPGEKTKIIIIDTIELISEVKEKIARLFNYDLEEFLLSSGGILLVESMQIKDYDIDDDDEIALIPSKKK